MKKVIISTLIVSAILSSVAPITSLAAALPKKAVTAAVKSVKPTFTPVRLLNAKVTDEHLYHVFTGELLVFDTGASKQIAVVVGNQVINARYKATREDGKEIWSFSLGFNRASLYADDALTFAIRYKSGGKVYWDTNQKYRLTDNANVIFGDTTIKLERSIFDWTFNSVNGSLATKRIDRSQSVSITYSTDGWLTRNIISATLKETNGVNGLQYWDFKLPTSSADVNVQYFITLVTPQKIYIDNNAGLGYNIYR